MEDPDNLFLYETQEELIHITNISYYKEIFEKELTTLDEKDKVDWETQLEINTIGRLLDELTTHRAKRSINELGTILKFITGTPDHDDLLTLQLKINELTQNNNKQNKINSILFKEIEKISKILKLFHSDQDDVIRKYRLKLIVMDLQNLIDTITLSKANILNPKILSR